MLFRSRNQIHIISNVFHSPQRSPSFHCHHFLSFCRIYLHHTSSDLAIPLIFARRKVVKGSRVKAGFSMYLITRSLIYIYLPQSSGFNATPSYQYPPIIPNLHLRRTKAPTSSYHSSNQQPKPSIPINYQHSSTHHTPPRSNSAASTSL